MDKIKKVGDFPTNSRIHIKYQEGDKPKIDFEYPDNKRQIKDLWKSSGIGLPAIILSIITVMILSMIWMLNMPADYPKNCDGTILTSNTTFETTGINLFCDNITRYYFFSYERTMYGYNWVIDGPETRVMPFKVLIFGVVVVILYLLFILIYGKIFSFFVRKTEWGKNKYPLWNKHIHNKHWQAMFTECPDSLKIEIPLFSNIYLDYEAEEEFADYLTEVEIKEHDVKYIKTKKGLFKRKKELIPNVYLWKAIFTFKKKPTKGFLKVEFT